MYTQADEIAMVEDLQWQWDFHAERYREDAHKMLFKLDQHLKNFRVPIRLNGMKRILKQQKSGDGGHYNRKGKLKGQEEVREHFVNGIYGLSVDLRSNPQIIEVQRQLFIHHPFIRVRERLFLKCFEGVEATLTSEENTLTVPYQELRNFNSYRGVDRGFFVPEAELSSGEYFFEFKPTEAMKKIDISFEYS